MRKVVARIAKRTGLSPYKARNRAEARGLVPPRPMKAGYPKRRKPSPAPKLTGTANALTRGKGNKYGLKRREGEMIARPVDTAAGYRRRVPPQLVRGGKK